MNSIYLDNQKGSSNGRPNNNVCWLHQCPVDILIKKKNHLIKGVTLYNLLISRYIKDGYNIHMRNSKENTFM